MNKKSFLSFVIALGCAGCFAADVKSIVNPDYYSELMENGMVRIIHADEKDAELKLVPESPYKNNCFENSVAKKDGNFAFVTESLYLISKQDIKAESKLEKDNVNIEDVSVVFRSVSKMEGLTFYSLNRKREEVLYKAAYFIDNPEDRNRIPDLTEGSADNLISYVIQQDVSFGKCCYKLEYHEKDDNFYAIFRNIDSMGFGPIKAVAPGNMVINVIVVDCGDSLLLYLETDTDSVKFINIKKTLENSLVSRMDALKKWFMQTF